MFCHYLTGLYKILTNPVLASSCDLPRLIDAILTKAKMESYFEWYDLPDGGKHRSFFGNNYMIDIVINIFGQIENFDIYRIPYFL